jgi:hypothetical protein
LDPTLNATIHDSEEIAFPMTGRRLISWKI